MLSNLTVLNSTCSMLLARRNHFKNLSYLKLNCPSIQQGAKQDVPHAKQT